MRQHPGPTPRSCRETRPGLPRLSRSQRTSSIITSVKPALDQPTTRRGSQLRDCSECASELEEPVAHDPRVSPAGRCLRKVTEGRHRSAVCPAARARDREHSVRAALRGTRSERSDGSASRRGAAARSRAEARECPRWARRDDSGGVQNVCIALSGSHGCIARAGVRNRRLEDYATGSESPVLTNATARDRRRRRGPGCGGRAAWSVTVTNAAKARHERS